MRPQGGRLCRLVLLCLSLLAVGCTATVSRTPRTPMPAAQRPVEAESGATASGYHPIGTPTPPATATAAPTLDPAAVAADSRVVVALEPVVTLVLPTATPTHVAPPSGPPDRVSISSIGVDAPVVALAWVAGADGASEWQAMPDGAAGWLAASAFPGRGSNVVIAGHHNIAGEVFRRLLELRPGDEILVTASGAIYRYVVSDRLILPERDASEEQRRQNATWMQPTRGERLTLITCWPFEGNSHRLIVVASPVGDEQKVAEH